MITSIKKIAYLSSNIVETTTRVKLSQQVFRLYPVNSSFRRVLVKAVNKVGMYDALALLILKQYNTVDKLRDLYTTLTSREKHQLPIKDYFPLLKDYTEDELLETEIQTGNRGVRYNEYPGIYVRSFTYKPVKRENPRLAVCTKVPSALDPEVIYIVPERVKMPEKYTSIQVVSDELEFVAGYLGIVIDDDPKQVNALLSLEDMSLRIEMDDYKPNELYINYLKDSCNCTSEYNALVVRRRLAILKSNRTKILELPDDFRYDLLKEQINSYKTAVLLGNDVVNFAPGELIKGEHFTSIFVNQLKEVLNYLISYEEERIRTVYIHPAESRTHRSSL